MNPQGAGKRLKKKRPVESCRDEVSLIGNYLKDNLSAAERQAFETHLGACDDCRAFLATYKKTIEMTRSFLRAAMSQQPRLQLRRSL